MDSFLKPHPTSCMHNNRFLGFLLLILSTQESKLLQTIEGHVAAQLHSPLRPKCSTQLYRKNLFQLSLYI